MVSFPSHRNNSETVLVSFVWARLHHTGTNIHLSDQRKRLYGVVILCLRVTQHYLANYFQSRFLNKLVGCVLQLKSSFFLFHLRAREVTCGHWKVIQGWCEVTHGYSNVTEFSCNIVLSYREVILAMARSLRATERSILAMMRSLLTLWCQSGRSIMANGKSLLAIVRSIDAPQTSL